MTDIIIKDARHAHTAAMRIRTSADMVARETELSPEVRAYVMARLRQIADEIEGAQS